jgi:hypothetical protein
VLLDKTEQYREQDDDRDDRGLEGMAEESGDNRGAQQNQDQRVLELREERPPRRLTSQRLQLVRAMDAESARWLGTLQSGQGRTQLLNRHGDRQRVPGWRLPRALFDVVLRGHTRSPAPLLWNFLTIVTGNCIDK